MLDFIGNFTNAFKIIDYVGMSSNEMDEDMTNLYRPKSYKEIFNLPLGCEVHFDEKVLNIFTTQALEKANINRHNIHKILIQQFLNLCIRLNKVVSWGDINKNCFVDSSVYKILYKNPKELALQVEDILLQDGIVIE